MELNQNYYTLGCLNIKTTPPNENMLEGKTAFVTGGGSGIGKAIAIRLYQAGAKVVICGRNSKKLKDISAQNGGGYCSCCNGYF